MGFAVECSQMKRIADLAGNTLTWVQEKALKRAYELRFSGEVVAGLRFEKAFGSLATAESVDGSWTFKREGFMKPRVTVRVEGSDANVAVFHQNLSGGGAIEFQDGRRYLWRCTSFWGSEWCFLTPEDHRVVQLKVNTSLFRNGAQVTVQTAVADVALLAMLGWYLMVLMAEDTAASTAAIMAGA